MYGYSRRRVSQIRIKKIWVWMGLVIILVFWGYRSWKRTNTIISPIPVQVTEKQGSNAPAPKSTKNADKLKDIIRQTVNNRWLNYSVLVKDMNSDFEAGINESVVYYAASVNKVPILAALYYEAQKGNIDLAGTITLQAKDIQDYGTGSIRYEPPGTVYSIKTLANLMIKKSDNTAAYILSNHIVGSNKVNELCQSWGLTQTDVIKNDISNRDISILFEKIYENQIVGTAFSQEMLSFLSDTDFEDRLPALLPDEVVVYHKIGTEVRLIHDAGIVKSPTMTYYIGVFSSDVPDEKEAVEIIAEISKAVYEYMK